ncbi:hypothetical protein OG462_41625 [Streptomyces sp. NBC_01077]|uniref:hypothetical protein n=1 Tax=Streptomyces sp. NBC_01077 TaxID=2903746 RepID=UPI003868B2F4|nr:hypothetical protein OG462_41625 [Streptomyces sp. NBC_01077]
MSRTGALMKGTWLDWAVLAYMVVTATTCQSPILVVFFTVIALAVAVVCVRKTWRLARLADIWASPSASEEGADHRS